MDTQIETVEVRLKSFLDQLKVEYGILDRIVYKNKNQHRRCSYFQYLLKVRSDLRLVQSVRLEDILNSAFLVIHGKRAKQKVQLLESLKRRKCDGQYSFLEKLAGAARLLSQIIEPTMKAAMEISTLLARSFFMGFSLTVMALLARLRVLVQQILFDVVTVFNVVSSLSRKEQSVKLNQDGLEVFRDLYPANEKAVYLECVWQTHKFVLLERINEPANKIQDVDLPDVSVGASGIKYQSIEAWLAEDEQGHSDMNEKHLSLLDGSADRIDGGDPCGNSVEVQGCSGVANSPLEGALHKKSSLQSSPVKLKPEPKKKVAFVSVKMPVQSTTDGMEVPVKNSESSNDNREPVLSLIAGGNIKENL